MLGAMLKTAVSTTTFKKLVGASAALSAASLVQLIAGIIRNKVLALTIGPAGVGLLAQLSNFQTTAALVGQQGIPQGATRYLAESKVSNPSNVMSLVKTAYLATALGSFLVAVISLILAPNLAIYLLEDTSAAGFVSIAAFGALFTALFSLSEAILQSFKQAATLSVVRILSALASVLILAGLLWLYQLTGAVWSLPAQALVGSLIAFGLSWRCLRQNGFAFIAGRYSFSVHKSLLQVGATVVLTLFITTGTVLLVRSQIIHEFGMEQHGIFQAAWALTQLYVLAIIGALGSYTYPQVCELQKNEDRTRVINDSVTFCLLLMIPMAIILTLWGKSLISLFYSTAFLEAAGLLPAKVAADTLTLMAWAIGTPLLPMNRLSAFVLLNIISSLLFFSLVMAILPGWNLQGVMVAYLAANVVSLVIYLFDAHRAFRFRLTLLNLALLVGIVSIIAILCSI